MAVDVSDSAVRTDPRLRIRRAWRAFRRALQQRRPDYLIEAYAASIARRVPMLYLVLVFDVAMLMLRFRHQAPGWVLAIGLVLLTLATVRGRQWLPSRVARMTLADKRRALARMSLVGGGFALTFMVWTLLLSAHATVEQTMLLQYVLAVTAFAAIVALAHAPRTALYVALAFSIPATAVFLVSHDPGAIYLSLVQMVFTATMVLAIVTNHRDFVRMELSRQRLARQLARIARESQRNYRRATIDDLTGGLNRRAILTRLRNEVARAEGPRAWLALVDLDGFKHVNDTYGHAAGDEVLRAAVARIGALHGVLSHGRLGGDEFAVLFDASLDAAQAQAACTLLSAAIRQPIQFQQTALRVHASIGLYRLAEDEVSACLERADAALYQAKERGEGAVVLFGGEAETALRQRALITRQFNDSVLEDRLRLVYQPVIDLGANKVVALEAFARWSPDGVTWQAPAAFMAMAEATGRIGDVTRVVMARALAECAPWQHGVALSVNLSPRDVLRGGTVDILADLVAAAGGQADQVILEVTERALLADPRRATRQLQAMRERGFRVALDDFGTGWSSLSQLRDLPLDSIKLDRALAIALPTDPGARAVTGMIVALAWQLGLGCTIKGIETEEQAQAARALGITLMQGFRFGRPDSAERVLGNLARAVA